MGPAPSGGCREQALWISANGFSGQKILPCHQYLFREIPNNGSWGQEGLGPSRLVHMEGRPARTPNSPPASPSPSILSLLPPPPLLILPGKLLPGAPGPLLDRLAPKDPPSPTASQLGTPASSVPGVEDSCSPDSEPMLSAHPPRLPPLGDAGRPSANARCWGRKWLKVPPDRLVICWAGAVSPASCAHREKGGGRGPQAVISPLLLQIT